MVDLKSWQVVLVILGIILLISGPSLILAYVKLRKRNLGPILDANGWAVNAKAKINLPFGKSLTQVAKLPPGSSRNLNDPFAEKKRPWKLYGFLLIVFLLALCWYLGRLDKYLPGRIKSTSVMGTNAPAYHPPPTVSTNAAGR
jgi:Na+/melibiose symporter-like transporter